MATNTVHKGSSHEQHDMSEHFRYEIEAAVKVHKERIAGLPSDAASKETTRFLDTVIGWALDNADRASRLSASNGALIVDRDRGIREASKRALDCAEHGKIIASLEWQVAHFDDLYQRTEDARLTYVSGLHEMASFLEATQAKAVGAPDVAALAERVARGLKRIQDTAHRRWKK